MKTTKFTAVAVAAVIGLGLAAPAMADSPFGPRIRNWKAPKDVHVSSNDGTVIQGPAGGPYRISRNDGKNWDPYVLRDTKPKPPLPVVPPVAGQNSDFYQTGNGNIIVVPAGSKPPKGAKPVGTGVIHGGAVDPKTNLLR